MWVVFEQEKTKRAFSNALFLRKKLCTYTYKKGMNMDKFLDKMEHMRRQLRNMNDEITDSDMVKLIPQGVAFEYRGVVRMFDKERSSTSNKSGNTIEEAKIMQMKQQQQVSGAKGKRHSKQNRKTNSFKKFKNKNGEAGETRTCYFCQMPGHLKRNCDECRKKRDQNETESAGKDGGKKWTSMSLSWHHEFIKSGALEAVRMGTIIFACSLSIMFLDRDEVRLVLPKRNGHY
ncbi:hypothetical protein PHMEG_00026947 [Phytophthora megakarya]|uniref:CCHC-type domain-containing protein n=1 Tax=Phytophthora megakarya TaxID=4795 RepID=A0A225V9I3_9STRA|nr:hypothetical protein PHMEG_00026947 [Phytophthora megakarya]